MPGLLDWLTVTVFEKKKKPKAGTKPRRPPAIGTVDFDSKSFPIAAITAKGVVASQFDGSLIKGQNARITVSVSDSIAKFSFATTVTVEDVTGDKMVAAWTMLPPETESLIRKYNALKKQKAGAG